MNSRLTESQRILQQFVTGWQREWARRFINNYRRENAEIEVPPAIDAIRAMVDNMHADVKEIKQKTGLIEGIAHTFANLLKSGGKDAEKTYPSKSK